MFEADDGERVPTILRFDASSGVVHHLPVAHEILGAAQFGVFTVEGQGGQAATLHRLDEDGGLVWSHALTSTTAGIWLGGAVPASDGGAIVFGFAPGALDLVDHGWLQRAAASSPGLTPPVRLGGCNHIPEISGTLR